MLFGEINELIRIFVFFDGSKIVPLALSWRGKRYDKLKVQHQWAMRRGDWLDQHFSLTDGKSSFEVMFDQCRQEWRMVKANLNKSKGAEQNGRGNQ